MGRLYVNNIDETKQKTAGGEKVLAAGVQKVPKEDWFFCCGPFLYSFFAPFFDANRAAILQFTCKNIA